MKRGVGGMRKSKRTDPFKAKRNAKERKNLMEQKKLAGLHR